MGRNNTRRDLDTLPDAPHTTLLRVRWRPCHACDPSIRQSRKTRAARLCFHSGASKIESACSLDRLEAAAQGAPVENRGEMQHSLWSQLELRWPDRHVI